MAETAVSFVIDKLVPLLSSESNLLKGIHKQVADIKDELESMQSFLRDADAKAERGEADGGAKTWVKQVRELAYEIEDVIDEYMLQVARRPDQQGFSRKIIHFVKKLKPRHQIASEIQELKNSVREVKERSERYNFSSSDPQTTDHNNTWHDPRMASLFVDEAELVGIETPRNDLVSRLVAGSHKKMVISVVGMGGLGKTTLAKKVFDHQTVKAHFECHAWVTVSQTYKIEELLRNMIREFQRSKAGELGVEGIEAMEEEQLISKLRKYLKDERYVVVLDDIWNVGLWEHMNDVVLPDNGKGSRILITSRKIDITPSEKESSFYYVYKLPFLYDDQSIELFHKKVFQSHGRSCPQELLQLSQAIVERCQGLPLAIVIIGGVLTTKEKSIPEWNKFYDGLRTTLSSNEGTDKITRILSLSYNDLPYYLKNCFLYFGMFLEDKFIGCSKLQRLWMAEGFIKERLGKTTEDIAQEHLTELIHRSLVQVAKIDIDDEIRECRMHDLLLDTIHTKSRELGFHQTVLVENCGNLDGMGRRISIRDGRTTSISDSQSMFGRSKTRSVLMFCVNELPNSLGSRILIDFMFLKVLDFEGAPLDNIPEELGKLLNLHYLSLKDTNVGMLPMSFNKLLNLQTLDLRECRRLQNLSIQTNALPKLQYLVAHCYNVCKKYTMNRSRGLKIEGSIQCLTALRKLRYIEVDDDIGLIKDLQSLTQLRTLGIWKLKREHGLLLCTALEKMAHLSLLSIYSAGEEEYLDIQSLSHPPPLLQHLYLDGPLAKLPSWISKLNNLMKIRLRWSRLEENPLRILRALPNLVEMEFEKGYSGEKLHFEKGCFQKLKKLRLHDLVGLKELLIDEGGLASLEEFYIGVVPKLNYPELPSAINSLRKLKTLYLADKIGISTLGIRSDKGEDHQKIEYGGFSGRCHAIKQGGSTDFIYV